MSSADIGDISFFFLIHGENDASSVPLNIFFFKYRTVHELLLD